MQACLLIYDVPDGSIPMSEHPCVRLRSLAVRIQLSGWVILEGNMPYAYLNYLTEKEVTWDTLKFDQSENEKLIRKAITNVKNEIRERIRSAKESFKASCQALNNTDRIPEDKMKRYDASTKATVKRLQTVLADLRKAASTFGIDDNDLNVMDAYREVNALQASMRQRAEEYQRAINQLKELNGNHAGMIAAATADQVPAGILADYLDDNGGKGKNLRNLFE